MPVGQTGEEQCWLGGDGGGWARARVCAGAGDSCHVGADEDADGPLAAVFQDVATASHDRAYTTSVNEEPQIDPFVRD